MTMLRLGTLGHDIVASAEPDGWYLRPTHGGDLAVREGWPAAVSQDAAGHLVVLQVEQLLDLELADPREGAVAIPWDRFADALEADLPLAIRWTEPSPLMLTVNRLSDLGRADFEYRYSYRLGAKEVDVERVGYFVRHKASGRLFHLDAQTYGLVAAMDRFNALPPDAKTKRESWLAFATVKGCSRAVGASLDATLEANDVVVPSQIGLSLFVHEDESLSFVPTCPELPGNSFQQAFLRAQEGEELYQIDGGEGQRVRIVLGDRHRLVLDRMKGVQRVRGARKEEALRHPERFFEGLLDAVEIKFWDRVIGIGDLPLPTMPHDPRSTGGFFDGAPGPSNPPEISKPRPMAITLPGPEGQGEVHLSFRDDLAVAQARRAVVAALERGETTVQIHGQMVAATQEVLEALARDPVQPDDTDRGTKGGRMFLLIHTNETEAWVLPKAAQEGASVPPLKAPFELPSSLRRDIPLKTHQLRSLQWLRLCDQLRPDRRGVLLADDMGLGKTLQILTHLAWLIEEGRIRALPDCHPDRPPYRPILIVAPLILVENETWVSEMRRFFAGGGELFEPLLTLHGGGISQVKAELPAKAQGPETVIGRPLLDADRLMRFRTVITNYETVVNYQHSLAQLKNGRSLWSVIVTDEAQKYKSPNTKVSVALKAIDTDFHIASTGTPVENRLLDLWNIMDTLQPGHVGTARDFSATYERSLSREVPGAALEQLRRVLHYGEPNAFLLRRTKEDLLAGELPQKRIVRLDCEMSSAEVAAHQDLLAALGTERKVGRHLTVLHRLQQLYQHSVLLESRDQLSDTRRLIAESSKLRAVLALLREIEGQGEKAIIFARLIDVQQMLAQVIEAEFGTQVPIINGAANKAKGYTSSTAGSGRAKDARKRVLDRFREQPGFGVIILSPFVAGIGLTITEANHVIHYGRWWNPAVEAQATDRVYRIGQARPVSVYLPVLRDPTGQIGRTFDQALDDLLTRKTALARDFLHPSEAEDENAAELCDALLGETDAAASGSAFTIADINRLSPADFEAAVAALFRAKGYEVILTALGNDGGADVIAIINGRAELIQAKHSATGKPVDIQAVSDLLGAMDIYREQLGVNVQLRVVSNAPLTPQALGMAKDQSIEVLVGNELAAQMLAHGVGLSVTTTSAASRCVSFGEGVQRARSILGQRPHRHRQPADRLSDR